MQDTKRPVSLAGVVQGDDRPLITTCTQYTLGSIAETIPANPRRVFMLIEAIGSGGLAGEEVQILIDGSYIMLPAVGSSLQFDKDFPYWQGFSVADPQSSFTISITEMSLP